jgi:hypothetical protein
VNRVDQLGVPSLLEQSKTKERHQRYSYVCGPYYAVPETKPILVNKTDTCEANRASSSPNNTSQSILQDCQNACHYVRKSQKYHTASPNGPVSEELYSGEVKKVVVVVSRGKVAHRLHFKIELRHGRLAGSNVEKFL